MRRPTTLLTLLAVLLGAGVALAGTPGALDDGFGIDGIRTIDGDVVLAVGAQSDGKIVAAGHETTVTSDGGSATGWLVRRFHADGTLDTSFGIGGEVTLFGDRAGDTLIDMAITSDDEIVLAGNAWLAKTKGNGKKVTYERVLAVSRLLADGSFDTDFGSSGVATVSTGASAAAVAVQADGKVVVAGRIATSTDSGGGPKKGNGKGNGGGGSSSVSQAVCVLRLTSGGALDTGFGDQGIATHDLSTADDGVRTHCLGLQSTGKIVLGVSVDTDHFALVRCLADGGLDSGFGTVTEAGDSLSGIAIDPADDAILATGFRIRGTNDTDTMVVRYGADGSRDSSFGTSGEARAALSGSNYPFGVALDAAGSVLVGVGRPSDDTLVALRLDADGQPDGSFGTSGVSEAVAAGDALAGRDVAVDADGDLFLAGYASTESPSTVSWLLAAICGQ